DRLQIVLGQEIEFARCDAEALGSQLDLTRRFLARDVQHGSGSLGEGAARLQEQRRLADAGVAPDQHERALDHTATEDPVQLADPGGASLPPLDADLPDGPRARAGSARDAQTAARGRPALFHQLYVAADTRAVGARARLGRGEPALLTSEHRSLPRH